MSAITDKWIKLFNNVNNSQELDTFLKNVSGKGLNEWEQLYNDYDESKNLLIEEALEQCEWILYIPQQRLKTRINWLDLYKPLCYKYVQKIYSIVETKNYISDKQTFIESIEEYFFDICMNISYRTVVLEINDLRRNSKLLGESREDRYKYYIDILLRDKEYIVDF
ncbi:TPA: type 2 lantipeptide synthetase LanM, partial [Streptococcus suis]